MTEYLQTLFISGMACLGCAGEIKYALEKNPSISVKKVNLEEGLVTIAAKTDLSYGKKVSPYSTFFKSGCREKTVF